MISLPMFSLYVHGICIYWRFLMVCFYRFQSWKSPPVIYFLVVQLLAVVVAFVDIYGNRFGLFPWQESCWGHFLTVLEQIGLWVLHYSFSSCFTIILMRQLTILVLQVISYQPFRCNKFTIQESTTELTQKPTHNHKKYSILLSQGELETDHSCVSASKMMSNNNIEILF